MITGRKLRPVPANPRFQSQLLIRAAESINAASQVADSAPSTAFIAAYDGMRHCVDAHLNSHGLRVESGEGGHRHRADYAELAMTEIISPQDLRYYRAARDVRNAAEYPEPTNATGLNATTARAAIEVARRFRQAVWDTLKPPTHPGR